MGVRLFLAPSILLLAACSGKSDPQTDLAQLDRELTDANSTGNLRDPAVAEALHAPIMVDPTLAQSSNANAVRPPSRPDSGAVPPDLLRPDPVDARTLRHAPVARVDCPQCRAKAGAFTLGALAAARPGGAACADLTYSATWANRLPADLPLYPNAAVIEAAGKATATCRMRVVSFRSSAAPAKLIDWYYTRATAARYSAEHLTDGRMQVLGGARGGDAYMLYVTPRQRGGADVDLVTKAGS